MAEPHGWTHDGLAEDLAGHLRCANRMTWLDMQLGPSGSPRPDVFTLERSYSKPRPTAYEIKISRSDLRSDTTSGKWQSYLAFASSVTFAVPDGLCTPADIPRGCGLIVRKKEVWRYVRRPTIQPVSLPMDACMKLLIDGVSRIAEVREPKPRTLDLWREHEIVRQRFGEEVARCARDLVAARRRLDDAKSLANGEWDRMRRDVEDTKARLVAQAKQELETWSNLRREVLAWLNLPEGTTTWAAEQRLRKLKRECDADQRVERAEMQLAHARTAVHSALRAITPEGVPT